MVLPALSCPTSAAGLTIAGLQCLNLLAGANELASPTPYSKFATASSSSPLAAVGGDDVPSRTGMLAIYVPPAVTAAAALGLTPSAAGNGREAIVCALLLVHFVKRVLETLFVHRYSGTMKAATAGFIGVFYSLVTMLISVMQAGVPASVYAGADQALAVALSLFGVGELGNLWHHALLADMRKHDDEPTAGAAPIPPPPPVEEQEGAAGSGSGSSVAAAAAGSRLSYRVPSGGLFDLVTAPHYLFEITAWVGIAVATQQLNACLVALGMASYLAGRAAATTRWYADTFGAAWPAERRHLVPFLF